MTAQEELDQALAELAEANARLAKAKADLAAAKAAGGTVPRKSAKRTAREVHHPESGLRSGVTGCGPAPVGTRVRINDAPVVMKHRDGTKRPVEVKYEGRECLLVASVIDGSVPVMNCPCASCNK